MNAIGLEYLQTTGRGRYTVRTGLVALEVVLVQPRLGVKVMDWETHNVGKAKGKTRPHHRLLSDNRQPSRLPHLVGFARNAVRPHKSASVLLVFEPNGPMAAIAEWFVLRCTAPTKGVVFGRRPLA